MSTSVTPAYLHGMKILAMNELQQQLKASSVHKQLGTKHSKRNRGRQEKTGGVKGRNWSAEELDRETGEELATVCRARGN